MLKRVKKKTGIIFRDVIEFLRPPKIALSGAAIGIAIGFFLIIISVNLLYINFLGWQVVLITILSILLVSYLGAILTIQLIKGLSRIPFLLAIAMLSAVPVLMTYFHITPPGTILIFVLLTLFFSLTGGAVLLLIKNKHSSGSGALIYTCLTIGIIGLVSAIIWFMHPGKMYDTPPASAYFSNIPDTLDLPDPSLPGVYQVNYLTYGSGQDKRRQEFGKEASLITPTVNGKTFLNAWSGFAGKMRTRYFGFDNENLPLNARVWYPDGTGPFPLVLVVHGNHLAQDYSDPGYEYLGTQLASRGYIVASVDQNFLNGSYTNIFGNLSNENGARGWLLLKHLQQWKSWNEDPAAVFYQKIDMQNIALIGHSRGGEAVAHAALFNRLPFFPDDANEVFDFNFNINAIIAIAPADGQYQPSNIRTPLKDINYLVLQGSHDADVSSYQGMRQFHRIDYSENFDGFKAGLYIYGANHGQFNSRWGRKDFMSPRINFFNLRQLISQENQKHIALVYISGFLESTLQGNHALRKMFKDHRVARHWLPQTIYLSQYQQSQTLFICNFQEDLDLTTACLPGSRISAKDLSIWREQALALNWGDYDTRGVVLGWNTSESDTLQPSYSVTWQPGSALTDAHSMLVFSMSHTGENANPPAGNNANNQENGNENNVLQNEEKNEQAESDTDNEKEPEFIDFTIELTDGNGSSISFPLSSCYALQPLLERNLTKLPFMQTAGKSENILQYFYFPLDSFIQNEDFDVRNITGVKFIFDKTPQGVVAVNNIGFAKAP
jgi:dienelactone hydrolase